MNVNHAVPSRDALRPLRTLALGTAFKPTCTLTSRDYGTTTPGKWWQPTLCTCPNSQIELSKRRKHSSRSWILQLRKQTSLAVAQEIHLPGDQESSIAPPIRSDELLQDKTEKSAVVARAHNGSRKIASRAFTTPDRDKLPQPIRDKKLEKIKTSKVDGKVKVQPPTDLSEMPVTFYATSTQLVQPFKRREVDGSQSSEEVAGVSKGHSRTELYVAPPYLSLKNTIPVVSQNSRFESATEQLSEAEFQRYFYVCNYFLHQIDLVGLRAATQRLCKYLQLYIHSSAEEDWRLVKLLHRVWSQNFATERWDRWYRWWEPLIQARLHRNLLNLDAVSLLYVQDQKLGITSSRPAEWYLETFCHQESSTDIRVEETCKILDGVKLCGFPLSERLLYPVITNMTKDGRPDLALQILGTMMERYGLTPDVHLLNTIAAGYAKNQDWSGYESLLSSKLFADVGVARYKPITFNVLLRTGLRAYAEHNSAEEVFDFITRHIQNYAIIPNNQLLDMVMHIFCEAKRYDLVQKWNRWKKGRFPLFYTTSSTATAAFNLSVSWRNSHASCSDILHTCLALASGEIHNPFPVHLRSIAEEMVFLDLRHRYARYKKALGQKYITQSPSENWKSMFVQGRQLIKSTKWIPKSDRAKLLAQDLEKQLEAVKSLVRLFAGQYSMAAVAARPIVKSSIQDTNTTIARGPGGTQQWPLSLQDLYLPSRYRDLVNDVSRYYELQKSRNLKPDYRLMLYVALRLAGEERLSDAYNFLQSLYESKWRTQEIWTMEVYTKWLEVASTGRFPTAIRRVLWTIIEAPETIRVSNTLSVLVRIARTRTHSTTDTNSAKVSVNDHEKQEMDYLVRRLRRRHWVQSGCPSAADIEASRFPAWSLIPVSIEI